MPMDYLLMMFTAIMTLLFWRIQRTHRGFDLPSFIKYSQIDLRDQIIHMNFLNGRNFVIGMIFQLGDQIQRALKFMAVICMESLTTLITLRSWVLTVFISPHSSQPSQTTVTMHLPS